MSEQADEHEPRITSSDDDLSPPGAAYVEIGLYGNKAKILLHVVDDDADEDDDGSYCWLTPKQAWKLAADLVFATVRLKTPISVHRALRAIRRQP